MTHTLQFVLGLAGALLTVALTRMLPRKRAAEFFNLVMVITLTFYFGSALPMGNGSILALEIAVGVVLFALVLAGQWKSLKFTAIAFVAHGAWDLAHVWGGVGANAGTFLPTFCVGYDLVIGCYVWWLASAGGKEMLAAAD
jgi:uncharacterized protein DUF6010